MFELQVENFDEAVETCAKHFATLLKPKSKAENDFFTLYINEFMPSYDYTKKVWLTKGSTYADDEFVEWKVGNEVSKFIFIFDDCIKT